MGKGELAITVFTSLRASEVMPAQSLTAIRSRLMRSLPQATATAPALIKARALCEPRPPTATKAILSKGPFNAASHSTPSCSAGKSFTTWAPDFIARPTSVAVATPGSSSTPNSCAAARVAGSISGATRYLAPASTASRASTGESTVPAPMSASSPSLLESKATDSSAPGEFIATSSSRTPPSISAWATDSSASPSSPRRMTINFCLSSAASRPCIALTPWGSCPFLIINPFALSGRKPIPNLSLDVSGACSRVFLPCLASYCFAFDWAGLRPAPTSNALQRKGKARP